MMRSKIATLLLLLAATAGLGLSIVSQLKICSACTAMGSFTIFGMGFGWFGIVFFAILLAAIGLRRLFLPADGVASLLIFSAAGAECHFIWLQKYLIGQWCPICLGIASAILFATIVVLYEKYSLFRCDGASMKNLVKQFSLLSLAFIIGLSMSVLGVTRQDAGADVVNPYLGKADSTTVVYFVSDWFCPACRKLEPTLERIFPEIARTVKVGFVDYPIHKETLNFTPYNLQFLYYEKGKYISLRKALSALSFKTNKPTADEVQKAVAPYGVKLREMNYADILFGMQSDLTVYRGFGLKSTPSVVVTDTKTKKTKILVGDAEITLQAIKSAIAAVRD
jgi:thioredoxin family protein